MDDIINIPVPRKHLAEVYALIARLEGTSANQDEAAAWDQLMSPNGSGPASARGWTEAEVTRAYNESPDSMKAILGLMADRPEKWLTARDLALQVDPSGKSSKLAGTLGAFARRTNNRYGKQTWPFEYSHDQNEHLIYRMSAVVAEWVKAATSA